MSKQTTKKIVKVLEFREVFGDYKNNFSESLEEWQGNNSGIKIIDTKLSQKVYTTYENLLLVTYEKDEAVEHINKEGKHE